MDQNGKPLFKAENLFLFALDIKDIEFYAFSSQSMALTHRLWVFYPLLSWANRFRRFRLRLRVRVFRLKPWSSRSLLLRPKCRRHLC